MIELNRRAIVTGIGAVAVAGVAPALSASAAPVAPAFCATATRFIYPRRKEACINWREGAYFLRNGATWHYHPFGDGHDCVIRHLPLGYLFVTHPRTNRRRNAVQIIAFRDERLIPDPVCLGYAARFIAMECRQFRERNAALPHDQRALYISYQKTANDTDAIMLHRPAPPLIADSFSRDHLAVFPS